MTQKTSGNRCKQMVRGEGKWGGFYRHQCSFKIWKDDFCKVHHPDKVKERAELIEKRAEYKRKQSNYYKLKIAQEENKKLRETLTIIQERFMDGYYPLRYVVLNPSLDQNYSVGDLIYDTLKKEE